MLAVKCLIRRLSTAVPPASEKYYFEVLKKKHRSEILNFLNNNFRVNEPLSKAARMTESDVQACFDGVLDRVLKNEVSIVARARKDGEIVGCMLSSVWRKDEKNTDVKEEFEFGGDRHGVVTVGEILNELHEQFWELRPEERVVLHFEISSVNENHQRQGLASKFLNWTESEELLKTVDASGIMAEASSLANQILLSARGYETVAHTMLSSRVDPATGRPILQCEDGTDRVNLIFKRIR